MAADLETANTVSGKLEQVETFMDGAEQTGSLVSRVDKLEKELYGQETSGSVMSRVDRLYNRVEGDPNNGQLSLAAVLNVIEWQFSDRMGTEGAINRIGNLETSIFGTQYPQDTVLSRVARLTKAAFPSGSLTSSPVVLPKDSLIKVKFMSDISSKTAQAGDAVDFVVDDNVYVGEALVLPKGAKGVGKIQKVVQPRIFGRDARIDLDFSHVVAVNGEAVPVTVGDLAKQQAKTAAGAAGASIGGMVLFGPVGIVGGAFVKGSSVTIPAGSNTYVQVEQDTTINGVILAGNTASGQQLTTAAENPEATSTLVKPGTAAQPAAKAEAQTEPAAEPAAELAAEPAAETQPAAAAPAASTTTAAAAQTPAQTPAPSQDASLDEPMEDVQIGSVNTSGTGDKADAETEAALAAARKQEAASQTGTDTDDGSAYTPATL